MLDPEYLRSMALAKRKERLHSTQENLVSAPDPQDAELIIQWAAELEGFVTTFAEDGYLFVDYLFKPEHSTQIIYAVAEEFKFKHPKLMVIISEGQKKITVSWDGKNYV